MRSVRPVLALVGSFLLAVLLRRVISRTAPTYEGGGAALERHHAIGLSRVHYSCVL
jgi:hypothetical protein